MHRVEPKVHLVAATEISTSGLEGYLAEIGAAGWETDTEGVQEIIEVMSRSCYRSFGVGLNPNITRVREGNEAHIRHILDVNHGSVLEHGWASFMFTGVSRVFTHELVRHRVGVAISQESLRFVRLDDLGCWIPSCFADIPGAVQQFSDSFHIAEQGYMRLLEHAAKKEGVASFDDLPFEKKKEYTSAARRVAPIGTATAIGWSCNMRALGHVIAMRTDPAAEEEIRVVFNEVALIAQCKWPNIFQA